ncbi:hypothetical protein H0H93_002277 [Arthromyces matolae]|nr:hypothetical protein H0H93_002277 [Arthromyces matolae]
MPPERVEAGYQQMLSKDLYPVFKGCPNILSPSQDTPHDLRHDLGSFFWCMTFICITRNGPGGQRREELQADYKGEITEEFKMLRTVKCTLFSTDDVYTLWDKKTKLFVNTSHYEEFIMPHFHTYFHPLKPLMKRWWQLLQLAHEYPMLETVHVLLRNELETTKKALRSKEPTPEERVERTKKILEQRKEQLTKLRSQDCTVVNPGPAVGRRDGHPAESTRHL